MEPDTGQADDRLHALFVAVDGGARATLSPLAALCARALHNVSISAAESAAYWSRAIRGEAPAVLVVGTSDSARGRRIESEARRAGNRAGLPIVAIEDFPGNYEDVDGGAVTMVVVESAAAAALCKRKLGTRAPAIEIAAAARYDGYRAKLDDLRAHTARGWALQRAGPPTVLWAGQPETEDCVRTLSVLLPVLRRRGVEVAFKAHPRDAGHAAGLYGNAFKAAGVAYRDFTDSSVEDTLAAAPRMVVTQFSSVAIESGFFGIPGLWILLPDAGGARLREKKGYDSPPLALAGGAFTVTHPQELDAALDLALTSEPSRVNLIRCFDDYFAVRKCAAAALLRRVSAYARTEFSPR